jgi:LysM repeat protein
MSDAFEALMTQAKNSFANLSQSLSAPTVANKALPTRVEKVQQHIVKKGETLSRIAAIYGTTAAALQRLNNITNPNLIRVGQVLQVRAGTAAPVPVSTTPTVQPATGEFNIRDLLPSTFSEAIKAIPVVLASTGTAVANYQQARTIAQINTERLRNGQDVLTPQQTNALNPAIRIEADIGEQTRSSVTTPIVVGSLLALGTVLYLL